MKPTLENWREEFDEQLGSIILLREYLTEKGEDHLIKGLKSFISNLLLSLLKRVKLKELKHPDYEKHVHSYIFEGKGKCCICGMSWRKAGEQAIYNQAIKDLQSLKKKLRKEIK